MSVLYIRNNNGNFIQIPSIPGKSAYEIAVEKGVFEGTEQEFVENIIIKDFLKNNLKLEKNGDMINLVFEGEIISSITLE